jgi:alanine racemase
MLFLPQRMELQAMIVVDIAKINYKEGDEVIIFNRQEMIQHIADISETIVYET